MLIVEARFINDSEVKKSVDVLRTFHFVPVRCERIQCNAVMEIYDVTSAYVIKVDLKCVLKKLFVGDALWKL
jgi:hypothetical protein